MYLSFCVSIFCLFDPVTNAMVFYRYFDRNFLSLLAVSETLKHTHTHRAALNSLDLSDLSSVTVQVLLAPIVSDPFSQFCFG